MSLRFRLNLLITLMFLLILGAGALLVIHHARRAVLEETRSTANLTLNLLEVAFAQGDADANPLDAVLKHLSRFEETRHLRIALIDGSGRHLGGHSETTVMRATQAPLWFERLVSPPTLKLTRSVLRQGALPIQIVVEADPADEISEAWKEARTLLGLLIAFCLLTNGLIYVTLGRSLKPIEAILGALENIERGDFKSRLPASGLPELDGIAARFNHMAEVLERSRAQNRQLAQKSLAIQEQERRYLAHELHDELGQSISAIKALAVSISQRLHDPPEIVRSAQTIAETSQRIYDAVRGMMRRLRPVILDELGLVPALHNVIDEWNARHGDSFCSFATEGDLGDLGDETRINAYRIVQEALTNITKHAHASQVTINLKRIAREQDSLHDSLQIEVIDNGIGFDVGCTPTGLGLLGMRERAEALDGRFDIVAKPGRGVALAVIIPIKGDTSNVRQA